MRNALSLLGLILVSPPAFSQPLGFGSAELEQELESDRPDFTEGTQTVDPGHVQIEAGYTFTRDTSRSERTEAHTAPELLLRAGLLETLELRLAWEGYFEERRSSPSEHDRVDGLSDLGVGFKQRIYQGENGAPDFSFLFELGLPVGSSDVTADEVESATKLLAAVDLGSRLSLGANVNLSSRQGEDERFLEAGSSAALGITLSERVASFLEYFGTYPESVSGEGPEHYIDGGFTFAVHANLQLDIRAGAGLHGRADDFFTGAGFVMRR